MPDYLQGLLDAIGNQKKEYYATNPYIGAAQGIAAYQPNTEGLSPWQGFALQALQGLGAGAAAGYGKSQADEQTRDFAQKYFGALGGNDPIAAFMADKELAQYAPAAQLYQMQVGQDSRDRQLDVLTEGAKAAARKQVELQYLPQELELKSRSDGIDQIDPRLSGLPKNLISKAINELGVEDDVARSYDVIGQAYETTKGVSSVKASIPFSEGAATFDSAEGAIISALQAAWKGPMSNYDLQRIKGLLPSKLDSETNINIKKNQMMELLRQNAKPTPILNSRKESVGQLPGPETTTPPASAQPQRYSIQQLQGAGYSAADIQALREQGLAE